MKKKIIMILLGVSILGSCLVSVNAVNTGDARFGHGGETIYSRSGERLGLAYQWNNGAETAPFVAYAETDSSPNVSYRLFVGFDDDFSTDVYKSNSTYVSTSRSYNSIPNYEISSSHAITKTLGTEGTAILSFDWNDGN